MSAPKGQGGSELTHIAGMRWTFAHDGSFLLIYRPKVFGELKPAQKLRLDLPSRYRTLLAAARDLAYSHTPGIPTLEEKTELTGHLRAHKRFVSLNFWPFGSIGDGREQLQLTVQAEYVPGGPDPSAHWTHPDGLRPAPADVVELCHQLDDFCLLAAVRDFPVRLAGAGIPRLHQLIYIAYHHPHTRSQAATIQREIKEKLPAAIGRPWLYDQEIGPGDAPSREMEEAMDNSRAAVVAHCPDFATGKTASWELRMFEKRAKEIPGLKAIFVACDRQKRSDFGATTQVIGWGDLDRSDQIIRGIKGLPLEPKQQ